MGTMQHLADQVREIWEYMCLLGELITVWAGHWYLEERMADGGVPLHCYGKGEVDGAGEGDVGQGQQDGHHGQVH